MVFNSKGESLFLSLSFQNLYTASKSLFDFFRSDGFKLKDSASGDDSVINIKIWIFCGGSNQGNLSIFQKFQKGLLLLFVEILDLIQIQNNTVHPFKGIQRRDDFLKVSGAGSGAVELIQLFASLLCNDAGNGSFAGSRRTVKNQIGCMTGLSNAV